jgi:hypothetical protein
MKSSIKYVIPLSLLVGAVVTPTFAFNEVTASVTELSDLNSAHEDTSVSPTNELQKIAAQLRSWNSQAMSNNKQWELTDTVYEKETSEERNVYEEEMEITKLDQVFFTYVMSKFIKPVRLS